MSEMLDNHGTLLLLLTVILGLRHLIGNGSVFFTLSIAWIRIFSWCMQREDARTFLTLITLTCTFSFAWIYTRKPTPPNEILPSKSLLSSGPLRPLIFPCKTTHTRLFPRKHSFGYSYLQVGIPVGWTGNVSSILGVGTGSDQRTWFSVDAGDYLARGQKQLGLDGKLATYLSSQDERIEDYAHAYLVTAPRFLGYAFNPVSFWYLFSKDIKLQAMILEVNNTFDERRMYFMKRASDSDAASNEDTKFAHTWPKDFHVSPFNSRKGDYTLAAINPFSSIENDTSFQIDNVITLKSSKGHAKIVARIFSTEPSKDPSSLTSKDLLYLLSGWFWVGFMTYPRILKEAAKLFFQRKLHVWFRPEVIKTSIGRRQSSREAIIGSVFMGFLSQQVGSSTKISAVEYTPPNGSHLDTIVLKSNRSAKTQNKDAGQNLKLQILTPQFYADIAMARSPVEYILAAERQPLEARTFNTSSSSLLAELLDNKKHGAPSSNICMRARTLSFFRRDNGSTQSLDDFAMQNLSQKQRKSYFQAAIAIVLAGKFLAGFDGLLDLIRNIIEVTFVWRFTGAFIEILSSHYHLLEDLSIMDM